MGKEGPTGADGKQGPPGRDGSHGLRGLKGEAGTITIEIFRDGKLKKTHRNVASGSTLKVKIKKEE